MAHLVRLYQAHCHISLPLAAAAKAATVSVSVSVWVPFLISLPDFPFFAIDSCQFSVLCFKCATRSLWHPPSPPSGGWVGGKVPFLHSSSSSGFKHSTLCCSFDTMSNNHEFYLDHKKKHWQQTDKWTGRGEECARSGEGEVKPAQDVVRAH